MILIIAGFFPSSVTFACPRRQYLLRTHLGPLGTECFTDGWSSECSLEPCGKKELLTKSHVNYLSPLSFSETHLYSGPQCPLHQNWVHFLGWDKERGESDAVARGPSRSGVQERVVDCLLPGLDCKGVGRAMRRDQKSRRPSSSSGTAGTRPRSQLTSRGPDGTPRLGKVLARVFLSPRGACEGEWDRVSRKNQGFAV